MQLLTFLTICNVWLAPLSGQQVTRRMFHVRGNRQHEISRLRVEHQALRRWVLRAASPAAHRQWYIPPWYLARVPSAAVVVSSVVKAADVVIIYL